LQLQ
jgi:hypothetical protein